MFSLFRVSSSHPCLDFNSTASPGYLPSARNKHPCVPCFHNPFCSSGSLQTAPSELADCSPFHFPLQCHVVIGATTPRLLQSHSLIASVSYRMLCIVPSYPCHFFKDMVVCSTLLAAVPLEQRLPLPIVSPKILQSNCLLMNVCLPTYANFPLPDFALLR